MMSLADSSQYCYPMIGLHPTSVKENFSGELEFCERITGKKIIAGSMGLGDRIDLYWDKTYEN